MRSIWRAGEEPPLEFRATHIRTAVASMRAMKRRASAAAIAPLAAPTPFWTALGPVPITNETPIFGGDPIGGALASASGKVTAIAVDPTTSGRLFIGTSGGGVWMSTNGGANFTPIFDSQPTLAIGAITLDPTTTPPTIYVGTGEANNTVDSYFGLGIFVSTDLGSTWAQNTEGGTLYRCFILAHRDQYDRNATGHLRRRFDRLEFEPRGQQFHREQHRQQWACGSLSTAG